MGYFDADMEDMLDIYLLETNQLLEQADEILLNAEKEKSLSKEHINGIFRVMHTIKSSSAMMGLTALSVLAHRLEDVFDAFRENPSRLRGLEQETFDLIFDAGDFIRSELARMNQETYQPLEPVGFDKKIDELVARAKENKTFVVRVKFEKDCRMENMRAYMTVRQIAEECSEIQTYPEHVETEPKTSEYIRENGFFIRFQSEDPDRVFEKLRQSLFVESVGTAGELPHQKNEKEQQPAQAGSDFIYVKVERLDELQNLTGELMIAAQAAAAHNGGKSVKDENTGRQLERLLKDLEELVISIRMVPFSGVVPQINRIVRDMSRKEGKEISFSVTGQEVEVDKKIADNILEPLLHLIRNAIDHGIETPSEREAAGKNRTGRICLNFENTGGEIQISVEDDGCGIDTDKVLQKARDKRLFTGNEDEYTETELLELCLLPGFSTRESANEYSGRGVGLDVVRQMVEQFGGHLHLESKKGEGSRFTLHLPLTLTIIDSIRLLAGENYFALPAHQVIQFFPYPPREAERILQGGKEFWLHEGRYIPVISLRRFYEMEDGKKTGRRVMAYVRGSTREACILADKVLDQVSLVEKPLPPLFGPHFRYYTGISGCSILGDGSICMQLDIEDLIRMAGGMKTYE